MKEKNQYDMQDPRDQYTTKDFPKQRQPYPGVEADMKPVPDAGEKTYVGLGRLKGRKALITGGDSGIGRAAAIAYAREGADVAINYMESEQKDAEEVKKLIEDAGRKAVLIPGNLQDEKFTRDMVQKAIEQLDGLDILVLNAGRQKAVEDIMEITTEQIRETFEINIYSMFWAVQEALPQMKPGSAIITTSSIQAYQPSEHLVDYASTKAAIVAFTRALAKQVADKGIRVNSIAPGPIWTPLQISGGQPQSHLPEFGHDTPMKRAGQPAELAGAYVFLASQESSYITAEVIGVTGGNHTS